MADIKVSVVMPIRNQPTYVKQAIFAVLQNTKVSFELVLVDDNSGRHIRSYLRHLPVQRMEENPQTQLQKVGIYRQRQRKGFPATCNNGIAHSQGDYICLLNTDTWVTPNWLSNIVAVGDETSSIGILGPSTNIGKQVLDYSRISHITNINAIGKHICEKYAGQLREMQLSGFCFIVKREVFDAVGVFDERFGVGTGEEGEFTARALDAGYQSVWVKNSYVHHFGGRSFKGERINGRRLRGLTQQLANAITDERRGKTPKHSIDDILKRIAVFHKKYGIEL